MQRSPRASVFEVENQTRGPADRGHSSTRKPEHFMSIARKGFTLIELLVVITIIGLLVSILIPAVMYARESARMVSCKNNLKQSILAVHSFHNAHGRFPSLYNGTFVPFPSQQIDEYHFHSWQTVLLPYLEQDQLFEEIDFTRPATASSNQDVVNSSPPTFICPSTSNYTPNLPDVYEWRTFDRVGSAARTDYQCIAGLLTVESASQPDSQLYDRIHLGVWGLPRYGASDGEEYDGVYRTRFADVTDGLSNTIAISEIAGRPDAYFAGQPDQPYDPVAGITFQTAWAISGLFWSNALYEPNGINETNVRGLYSFHNSGVNAAFADGSVRLLHSDTDRTIIHAWVTKAGNEVVGPTN